MPVPVTHEQPPTRPAGWKPRHHVWPLPTGAEATREVVVNMWWIYIVMPVLFALAIWGFISWTGVEKRFLTRKTDRRAEDMYDEFASGDHPPRS